MHIVQVSHSGPLRPSCIIYRVVILKYIFLKFYIYTQNIIQLSLPQFENWLMAWVYVRSIMGSTMYQKAPFCLPEMAQWKLVLQHVGSALLKKIFRLSEKFYQQDKMKFIFSIKYYHFSIFFFTTFIVECCNRLFRCNQTWYCVGMVSVMSTSRCQSPWKEDPLCKAEVDSAELADVRANWQKMCTWYAWKLEACVMATFYTASPVQDFLGQPLYI